MKMTRRRFLAGLGAVGAAVGADAFGLEATRVLVSRHDVRVLGLPRALDGLRIAQISDVHLPGNQLAARAALDHVRRERPEVVVLNGDMTESAQAVSQVREFAAAARGTLGTVAVLGNWEYRAGVVGQRAQEAYENTGVDLLINRSKVLNVGGAALALVGLDDALTGRPDLSGARAGLRSDCTEIWLVHEPSLADQLHQGPSAHPALLLAGHTHGGQIRIPFLPPVKPIGAGRFLEGWYRDTFAPLYVSRGIGTTGIPARFRCPAELPIFTLRTDRPATPRAAHNQPRVAAW
jgi:predicted MPP superfamily phosphohydrolase